MTRTLLVNMPCAAVERPPLGLSLLKAGLVRAGFPCDVAYLNLEFARILSLEAYRLLSSQFPRPSLAGEWVFAPALFDVLPEFHRTYPDVLAATLSRQHRQVLLEAASLATPFIENALETISWQDHEVVGFTSSGDQNIAALALAKRVKERYPDVTIAFGGPNWHDSMGLALHRHFPFVDAVFTGEADETFPQFLELLGLGGLAACAGLPGVSVRGAGGVTMRHPAEPVNDLDALPMPDFGDYFSAVMSLGVDNVRVVLPLEGSRGCWWADRGGCRFCGIAGARNRYRVKSPPRFIDELRAMASLPSVRLDLADNVVSDSFLEEVLPELVRSPVPVPLSVEIRPDVTAEAVQMLAKVCGAVQAGVESLGDRPLRLMRKGVTAAENVRFLLRCNAAGLTVRWNLLYGLPGESDEDYDEMSSLIAAVSFLIPPESCGPVWLDRFSVYSDDPERFGFHDRHAASAYSLVYPFPQQDLDEIAFAFDSVREQSATTLARRMRQYRLRCEVEEWQRSWRDATLRVVRDESGVRVEDTRAGRPADGLLLDSLAECLCAACEGIAGRSHLLSAARAWADTFHSDMPDGDLAHAVQERLDDLISRRIIIRQEDDYLSLVCTAGGVIAPSAAKM